jgi:hypothetical protein
MNNFYRWEVRSSDLGISPWMMVHDECLFRLGFKLAKLECENIYNIIPEIPGTK